MKCVICQEFNNIVCLCGFCSKCLEKYTHEGCYDILTNREYKLEDEDSMKERILNDNRNNPREQ